MDKPPVSCLGAFGISDAPYFCLGRHGWRWRRWWREVDLEAEAEWWKSALEAEEAEEQEEEKEAEEVEEAAEWL